MALCSEEISRTLNEFLFLPQISVYEKREKISLKTKITKDGFELNIPIVSAAMDTVTSTNLAVALALEGGMSFVSTFQSIEQQVKCIREIKKRKVDLRKESILDHSRSLDKKGSVLVGAAINTWDYKERIGKLVEAGADILCIDTMNGYNEYVSEVLTYIREKYDDKILVGAGNVVEESGFLRLVKAGADFVKIGMSGGVITPDREMYGVGLGQASAIIRVAKERDNYLKKEGIYIPLCADGYIRNNYQIALALAFGADFVMMGRYFAGVEESPGDIIEYDGKLYKSHAGQCSEKTLFGNTSNKLAEKGIDSLVVYKGKMSKIIGETKEILYRIFSFYNANDIYKFRERSIIIPISNASCGEKNIMDIVNI